VAEQGTHDELLARSGIYAELYATKVGPVGSRAVPA
jgi:ABC-type multidrug transport system fused ATPase/permease subunit